MTTDDLDADDISITLEEDIDDLIEVLQDDMRIMRSLKDENDEIRRTNKKLRKIITKLIKEVEELKQETSGEYEYNYSKGWKDRSDLAAEEIESLSPDEVEEQLMKIRTVLTGDDDGRG